MRLLGNVVAILVMAIGVVWALQGAGVIGGSLMSGRPLWLYIGIAMLLGGLAALWWINFKGAPGA